MNPNLEEFLKTIQAEQEIRTPKNTNFALLTQSAQDLISGATRLSKALMSMESSALTLQEVHDIVQSIFLSLKRLGNVLSQIESLQEQEIILIQQEYLFRTNRLSEEIAKLQKEIQAKSVDQKKN
ncbi:hypothetical protein M0811_12882 [Anaeramoeba ignava]|uniref:Uncharacterized protein n=1 Tax=Anaeramoeba ignava TaxID=1746090 RepID=A0A9Q0L8T3_ANAIG|nr:hypothetical protein M0811_12882 [Anaeramoeba ignava]